MRLETPQDAAAIRAVNEQAFGRSAEADLVEALRRGGALALSLVAVQENQIVGHIVFSPVTIQGAERALPTLGLGPMAVIPARQRQGPWNSGRGPSAAAPGSPDTGPSSAPSEGGVCSRDDVRSSPIAGLERAVELSLSRCVIRSWHPRDVPSLVRYANNRQVWRNLRDRFPHPYTPADAERWTREAPSTIPETHFAIAVGEEAVGGIGLELQPDVHRRSAEIGYWLGEPFWGRGIATEAVRAVTAFGFRMFDLGRIYACVFEWNPASMRVLEKAGYSLEGRLRKSVTKDGRTIDQFLYAILQGDADPPPRPQGAA